ncbi:MAG: tRNA (adenosine(37)-N6)-threonylcarbamoyltransferase complex dimerization subunit type 1 TsaB [Candidatus Omnitrophica bacterium]|nr:tRNA (adenosine(37)-N6)-threonylcarbamoyltransferase complex dimerization subunit type 1 TsaB [Candidatus Omnitrophota bacterium]
MRILGIDTATDFLCIALYSNNKIYEYKVEAGRRLSRFITVVLKRVLKVAGLELDEIDYLACGLGPGSFTGMRIGLATVKALSWSQGKPVIGISTLDILAQNAREKQGYIIPVIDAKRNLIYSSIYKSKNGSLCRVSPYTLLSQKELLGKIRPGSILLGDALRLYKENFYRNIKGAILLDSDYWYPQPRNIIFIACQRIRQKIIHDSFTLKPIYLYPKECQVKDL